ncbi:MAG: carboxypeptidase-like regulatory domain-containing protein [Syntrophales bacterium]|nr:carboxypeptidase-like regulatory domain-containing protein [Syntrophales bacterium]MDD5643353.1 carboxypeptidase-like regulatory domain-containing protein [Syntrophales bacterium]
MVLAGILCLPGESHANEKVSSQAQGNGTLAGQVSLGPLSPVERRGSPPARRPAAGVKLLIFGPEGQETAAVTTDADGQFRVSLPPGPYRLEMAPRKGKEFTKDLPATVNITPGRETRMDIHLDTRMR